MSLTALTWALLYCAAIAFSIINPLIGALGYLLEYYMRPELKWWGDELPALRYNLIISATLGATFLLRRASLREMQEVPNPALRWLIGLAVIMVFVTATVAENRTLSLDWTTQWVKLAIIFPLLLAGVIRTRSAFDVFIICHVLGAFWWGWESWLDPRRSQSRLMNVGSGDSLNDNAAAAHLLTVLPFALIFILTGKNIRLRGVGLLAAPFIVNTLILCNSRGSMVGILAALSASVFLIRAGYRLRIVGAGIGMVAMLLFMADAQFIERQQSTTNYEEDGSARQRLITWRGGLELMKDRPLGTGGRGFHLLSPVYIPEVVAAHGGDLRAPHNTWVMVATEWGVLGLLCFIGIYGSAFAMLSRVKRASDLQVDGFYYWRAFAMQLGLIAFLVAGAFTDRLYAEAGYWLVGLSYALYRTQRTDQAEALAASPIAGSEAPPSPLPEAFSMPAGEAAAPTR